MRRFMQFFLTRFLGKRVGVRPMVTHSHRLATHVFFVLLFFLSPGFLRLGYGQSAFPTLPDGTTNCNGMRAAVFQRDPAQSVSLWIRIVIWDPDNDGNHEHFKLRKDEGAGYKYISSGDPSSSFLNSVKTATYSEVTGSPGWRYATVEVKDPFPKGISHELINTRNVFHLGVAYGASSPSTFTYLTQTTNLPTTINLKYRLDGMDKPVVAGGVNICRGDDLTLSAAIDLEDRFQYSWLPGTGVQKPIDSSVVTIKGIVVNTTFTVTRSGMCDIKPTVQVTVTVDAPIHPVLQSPVDFQCGNGQVQFTASDVTNATEVKWFLHRDGEADGFFTEVGTDVVAGGGPVTRGINLKYEKVGGAAEGEPVRHIVRAIASKNNCRGVVDREITVYPSVATPDIKVSPLGADQCAPLVADISNMTSHLNEKGMRYYWSITEMDGSASPPVVGTSLYDKFRHTFQWFGVGVRQFKVKLVLKDKSEKCSAESEKDFNVNPGITADFTLSAESCSPTNVELTDVSVGHVATREWIYRRGTTVTENWGGGGRLFRRIISQWMRMLRAR